MVIYVVHGYICGSVPQNGPIYFKYVPECSTTVSRLPNSEAGSAAVLRAADLLVNELRSDLSNSESCLASTSVTL